MNIFTKKLTRLSYYFICIIFIMNSDYLLNKNRLATASTVEEISSNKKSQRVTLDYVPPVDDAPQRGRKPLAGRGSNCPKSNKSLLALVPKWHLALTVNESPNLWFYVPYSPDVIKSAELTLWDEEQNKISEIVYSIQNTPGIAQINVPEKLLEVDKRYKVGFSITCYKQDDGIETTNILPVVETWLKRVDLDNNLANQVKTATPREKYTLYAANGIWYEALTELIELKESQNNDEQVTKDWQDLLNQSEVNLPELISEPIVSCCTAK